MFSMIETMVACNDRLATMVACNDRLNSMNIRLDEISEAAKGCARSPGFRIINQNENI